ncbi:VPLPA-CTERM sorting domain-containing protein [Hyphococcus sp.]|uniref:VPLPA-CTERM sorting domain-containing protein n=1 Tax=Hyphococcus sp. TaxID=2038636 RepID=UPI00207EDAFB|nr:MAG: hypothetical protein DHS20C04_26150 [Marinicaulis sp.]
MFSKIKPFVLISGFVIAVASPASAAQIFFDSFESPDVSDWAVFQTAGDNGDWVADYGAGIEIQDQSLGITSAYHGQQYVELDSDNSRGGVAGGTNTGMVAVVPFIAGQTYTISFAYKPRTDTANDNIIDLFALSFDGSNVTADTFLLTANETISTLNDWMVYTVSYVAVAGYNAIGLRASGLENSLGGFIDAVSVSDVPIPAALPLFLAGLGGLAAARRKRKTA